ncbi:uncharacterized protein L969DRAFT_454107 [Mixia osmundae IAM 14324]|uniref:Prefoldin subunit 4 n=1 Tax=Mixia osmundae (strain CBS 9802 / IAM 14324 / JCM 22182 / KY 12970) TaxID=764103 RepID=G7DVL8_MIXOS|nr:uncharacterized protein L969DRAFT_454107 [Mixia osmundae IAM 14324]KEI39528.1 hypothetical protein L969DRAFT_454107 [Mixia osmundae IAM 14324]GAA94628.1 hypothetical protein E5Q_01280 [Mixia osmundae IAM 14324]
MRMLNDKDEQDAEVNRTDQDAINEFSKHNSRAEEVASELEIATTEKETLDDLSMELELADEDDIVPYKLQSCFLHLSVARVLEAVTQSQGELQSSIDALETESGECRQKMDELKKQLYGKFGSAINLERGDS